MDLPRIPKRTKEYLESGAPEGQRNAALFNAACQLRDAQWPRHVVDDVLLRRAKLDGLSDQEAHSCIKSVMATSSRDALSPHRPRALPTKYSLAPPEEPEEPVVYALDEADDLPEKMDNPSITFLQTLYSPEDKIQIVVGKEK